ncbi:MAG: AbrB/MazE/SpoVT family DNA-binding domain-containing protein [Microbacteriaceae bacterium]|nr:AbrB/MazE/SpoVT family DNA-binding domain-containing protein [Microbacteriaceae bacterium]
MKRSDTLKIDAQGAVHIPAPLLERAGWTVGDTLIAFDTDDGVLLLSRSNVEAVTSARLDGHELLAALMLDRRHEAAQDDQSGVVTPPL